MSIEIPRDIDLFAWLQEEVKPKIDERIEEVLSAYEYTESQEYHIKTGGKRWRPGLTMLIGSLCDLDLSTTIKIGSGIEMIHNFTLIHDDIMDGDEKRRGEPTVWKKFGRGPAIVSGDSLLILGVGEVTADGGPKLAKIVTDRVQQVCEGQQMDLNFENRRDVTVDEYMRMVRKKTGSLLEMCLEAPQVISGKSFELDDYSLLGPAFQIRDDLLDFEVGKGREKIGNDVRAGKRSLMVVHANSEEIYDILDKNFAETTEGDVQRVHQKLKEEKSIDFAEAKMEELARRALDSLSQLPEGNEKRMLEEMARFLIRREF